MESGLVSGSPVGQPGFISFQTIKNHDAKRVKCPGVKETLLFNLASASCPYSYSPPPPDLPPPIPPTPTTPQETGGCGHCAPSSPPMYRGRVHSFSSERSRTAFPIPPIHARPLDRRPGHLYLAWIRHRAPSSTRTGTETRSSNWTRWTQNKRRRNGFPTRHSSWASRCRILKSRHRWLP